MLPMLPCAEAWLASAGHLQPRPVRVGPRGSGPIAYGSPFPPLRALASGCHRDEGLGCASSISPSAGIEQGALIKDQEELGLNARNRGKNAGKHKTLICL